MSHPNEKQGREGGWRIYSCIEILEAESLKTELMQQENSAENYR